MDRRIIYDFGMNIGNNVPYYLHKADKVVGVEADPKLCEFVQEKYKHHIQSKKLIVINCALTASDSAEPVSFFIHKQHHVLSQMDIDPKDKDAFREIKVPQRTASSIIFEYGQPHYVKIDIEHSDVKILQEMHRKNIMPLYISAEIHSSETFSIPRSMGYAVYNMVEGRTVETLYKNARIMDRLGKEIIYSFPAHSAGPFGKDIRKTPWMSAKNMKRQIQITGEGWRDVHATLDNVNVGSFFQKTYVILCRETIRCIFIEYIRTPVRRCIKQCYKNVRHF